MPPVYTARVTVRHDEVDRFGRLHPATYLRYLSHAAVEASAAAGYDAAWYRSAGAAWLVRRSTFELARPARSGEQLTIRTWVEDFRRVRSQRRYEMLGADAGLRLAAVTDWVYVDAATGRPRRVPPDMERSFAAAVPAASPRPAWQAPPPPAAPALATHRVRLDEIDTFGHVNNAAWLDILAQGAVDALEAAGWPLDRLLADGMVPLLSRADVEYLDGAGLGEQLTVVTWFTAAPDAFDAHQHVLRAGADRPLVRSSTRWRCTEPGSDAGLELPARLLATLRPLAAA